ncbi:MAG: LysR family transcriptional regulator [Burkholderiaceae bacterium]
MKRTIDRLDLNDLYYFAQVVEQRGFAAAGRVLHEPKSKLSRRISALETRLGVRLLERSSRSFRVTEVGEAFYEHCKNISREAGDAQALVAQTHAEPQGKIRFSCPTGLLDLLSPSLPAFLHRYPKLRLQVLAVDRPVDLIQEGIDLALRVRIEMTSDSGLIMRTLGMSRRILVASPSTARGIGARIESLPELSTLSTDDTTGDVVWRLEGPGGEVRKIQIEPRLACADFEAVRNAAVAGLGVAFLPDHTCRDLLEAGSLVRVFPEWRGLEGTVHLVFTTRRGLPLAVRAFIDHLVAAFPESGLEKNALGLTNRRKV